MISAFFQHFADDVVGPLAYHLAPLVVSFLALVALLMVADFVSFVKWRIGEILKGNI